MSLQDLQERLSTDVAGAAAAIRVSRMLIVHGDADQVIPVEDGRSFAAVIPGSRLAIVPGADHNFRGSASLSALLQYVVGFLHEHSHP